MACCLAEAIDPTSYKENSECNQCNGNPCDLSWRQVLVVAMMVVVVVNGETGRV